MKTRVESDAHLHLRTDLRPCAQDEAAARGRRQLEVLAVPRPVEESAPQRGESKGTIRELVGNQQRRVHLDSQRRRNVVRAGALSAAGAEDALHTSHRHLGQRPATFGVCQKLSLGLLALGLAEG